MIFIVFFFNDTATTEIYTLSLHDALPILVITSGFGMLIGMGGGVITSISLGKKDKEKAEKILGNNFSLLCIISLLVDRKSTRLNSSHANISYAVFCLKKKKKVFITTT